MSSEVTPDLGVKLRSALSALVISTSIRSKPRITAEGFQFVLAWPDGNNGMASLGVTLPDGRSRTGRVQTHTKGRSPWLRDNAHRLSPEAVDLLVTMCLRNVLVPDQPAQKPASEDSEP